MFGYDATAFLRSIRSLEVPLHTTDRFSTCSGLEINFEKTECIVLGNREFKKLRGQLQRKRHIKIELCVKESILLLLHVDHVAQNRRAALSLAWYEWFSCKGKE